VLKFPFNASGQFQMSDSGATSRELEVLTVRNEHATEAELRSFEAGGLGADERAKLMQHLDVCTACRAALSSLHQPEVYGKTHIGDPLIGRMLGEYKVEAALSRGGIGVVYRGIQPVIGKKVAIKVLLPDMARDPDQIHRLLEEARSVNAIRHPNIIDIFGFGELPDGRHYFIMELLDGEELHSVIVKKQKLSVPEVLTVLDQTLSALGAAHAAGVIHRDLKPANIFVTTLPDKTWHLKVLDFGLAKQIGKTSVTSANIVMGTPGFMAPEQIRGRPVSAQTDLYSMGVIAWFMLTGQEPFTSENYVDLMLLHADAPLPSLKALAPSAPTALLQLVEQMLAKNPADRPASAQDIRTALGKIKVHSERETQQIKKSLIPISELGEGSVPKRIHSATDVIDRTVKAAVDDIETDPARDAVKRSTKKKPLDVKVLALSILSALLFLAVAVLAYEKIATVADTTDHVAVDAGTTPKPTKTIEVPPPIAVLPIENQIIDAGTPAVSDAGRPFQQQVKTPVMVPKTPVVPKIPKEDNKGNQGPLKAEAVNKRMARIQERIDAMANSPSKRLAQTELDDLRKDFKNGSKSASEVLVELRQLSTNFLKP
jgi:serine/threonine protein kinase